MAKDFNNYVPKGAAIAYLGAEDLDAKASVKLESDIKDLPLASYQNGKTIYCVENGKEYKLDKNGTATAELGYWVEKSGGGGIIEATAKPATDIKTDCFYRIADTINYTSSGASATLTVKKLWQYDGTVWHSQSTIALTYEQYQGLTDEQLKDGTTYVVNGATAVPISISYESWSDLPKLAGVTMKGTISLADIGVYSKSQVDLLLEGKSQMLLVDELPSVKSKNTFYYSKKDASGATDPDGKRFIYIVDSAGTMEYGGKAGDVDLTDYFQKSNILTAKDTSATDEQVYSAKYVNDGLLRTDGSNNMKSGINFDVSTTEIQFKSTDITGAKAISMFSAGSGKGAYMKLFGSTFPTTSVAGSFRMSATGSSSNYDLNGKPDGTLTWGSNDILTSAGGTLSGSLVSTVSNMLIRNNDTSYLKIQGGNNSGAAIDLCGPSRSDGGVFYISARDTSNNIQLRGKPDGTLTWNGVRLMPITNIPPSSGSTTYTKIKLNSNGTITLE